MQYSTSDFAATPRRMQVRFPPDFGPILTDFGLFWTDFGLFRAGFGVCFDGECSCRSSSGSATCRSVGRTFTSGPVRTSSSRRPGCVEGPPAAPLQSHLQEHSHTTHTHLLPCLLGRWAAGLAVAPTASPSLTTPRCHIDIPRLTTHPAPDHSPVPTLVHISTGQYA